jgi:3-hydroxyacyl-[acyl-carrier-protein] dehydratase
VRFLLFDRIVELKRGQGAILLKNVSQTEDYFTDHFPGYPVVPGSIILGCFEQGAEIFLAVTYDFACRPLLQRVSRASFRHFVLPGDQLELHLSLKSDSTNQIRAFAQVKGRRIADARLDFFLESPDGDPKILNACNRLKHFYELLSSSPLTKVWELWGVRSQD